MVLDAETDSIGDWTKGNNASLGNGGSLAGTLEISDVAPLNGTKSYQYTMVSGSLNDWWISSEIDLATRSIGKDNGIKSPFLYNGNADDVYCYVRYYNGSTWTTITDSEIKIPNAETVTDKLLPIGFIPTDATKIAFAFHVKVANPSKILKWDDSEFIDELAMPNNAKDTTIVYQVHTSPTSTTADTIITRSMTHVSGPLITLDSGGFKFIKSGKYLLKGWGVHYWAKHSKLYFYNTNTSSYVELDVQVQYEASRNAALHAHAETIVDIIAGETYELRQWFESARSNGQTGDPPNFAGDPGNASTRGAQVTIQLLKIKK